ncbi:hypothetical protein [Paraglaciecola sp. MB-3u-78]|jgi:hypothetical protein|uniref:hypothetical protein n=1 Tax=Paraglaciecola sp. MB-3u-78 TaxID=2058332 RepID=UPI000C3438B6|nr:hypothetical protein [Paraglaciecola sp. MB-3u-78]PKG96670.1 hypothetical protein CXF95_22870 [Paraglaciecola sp. MB-3u-78]
MLNIGRKLLFIISLIGVVTSASANLINNGGFEETHVNKNSWKWFKSSNINGWDGSNIEIWDRFGNFDAYEGEQHAELNSHSSNGDPFAIFQTIETEIGALYDVSFAYSARSNTRESFLFDLSSFNKAFLSVIVDDHQVKTWSLFNIRFEAIDLFTTIGFTSITPSTGTVGNFLDNISVLKSPTTLTSKVSAPSIAFFIMLVCMFLIRRKIISNIKN